MVSNCLTKATACYFYPLLWYTFSSMDEKTLLTLEYDKIIEKLGTYTSFGASREKALALKPVIDLNKARQILDETDEARLLLETEPSITIGGARDVREQVEGAARGVVLTSGAFLDVKATLISARTLGRQLEHVATTYPYLAEIALSFPGPMGLVDMISSTFSERGEVLDSASSKLGQIRSELRISHDRLITRMQKLLNNEKIAPYLQEALVTQRDGRYVIPVRAEAKGRVKAVVHDVSSSGATLFVEPLPVVDLNNKWRELQIAEKDDTQFLAGKYHAMAQMYIKRFQKWICKNPLPEYKRSQDEVNAQNIQVTPGWYFGRNQITSNK